MLIAFWVVPTAVTKMMTKKLILFRDVSKNAAVSELFLRVHQELYLLNLVAKRSGVCLVYDVSDPSPEVLV